MISGKKLIFIFLFYLPMKKVLRKNFEYNFIILIAKRKKRQNEFFEMFVNFYEIWSLVKPWHFKQNNIDNLFAILVIFERINDFFNKTIHP